MHHSLKTPLRGAHTQHTGAIDAPHPHYRTHKHLTYLLIPLPPLCLACIPPNPATNAAACGRAGWHAILASDLKRSYLINRLTSTTRRALSTSVPGAPAHQRVRRSLTARSQARATTHDACAAVLACCGHPGSVHGRRHAGSESRRCHWCGNATAPGVQSCHGVREPHSAPLTQDTTGGTKVDVMTRP